MKTYNGIVELTIGPLAGKTEVENRETKGSRTSPNNAGFYGCKW